MKIVVCVRTRNEERNIANFCLGHRWADKVLVADGCSEDETISIAQSFLNVEVRMFDEFVERNNYKRNPHGKHINFLIDWALEEGADWMVFDDCDCFPTRDLRLNARSIFDQAQNAGANSIFLHRLYIYLNKFYCPKMNEPGHSIWAWRLDSGIRAEEKDPWAHFLLGYPKPEQRYVLDHPYACLHRFFPDEETINRKLDFYRGSEEIKDMLHPTQFTGVMAAIPEWAHE